MPIFSTIQHISDHTYKNVKKIFRSDQKKLWQSIAIANTNRGKSREIPFRKQWRSLFFLNRDGSHHRGPSKKQWRSLWRQNSSSFCRAPFWWSQGNFFFNLRYRGVWGMVCIPRSLYQTFYQIFYNLGQYFSSYKGVHILKYEKIQTLKIDYLSPYLASGGPMV